MHRVQMVAALILAAASIQVPARDVSSEQSAVQFARQEYERAETEHKADAEQLARTRKTLDALKKQYEQEQKKASLSETAKQQAKAKLDRAEQALDRAWKN